jgi:hypothetical protein
VRIAPAGRRGASCRWSLVVETARGTLRTTGASEEAPQLAGLVAIDARRGAEILVALPSPAPPTPFAWFGVRGGRIVRFRIRPQTEVGDAFVAGEGFGLVFFSFGCVARGGLVQTTAAPLRRGYVATRSFYRLTGTVFRLERTVRVRIPKDGLGSLPELSRRPFARC